MHGKINLIKKRACSILPVLLVILLIFAFTATSLAWLISFKEITPNLSFTGGTADEYKLYQITCDSDSTVPNVAKVDSIGKSDFFANDLQFGKITNLGMLEHSNFIYYCVEIPKAPKTDVQRVSVGVSYNTTESQKSHFKIYVPEKVNGEPVYDENGVLSTLLLEDQGALSSVAPDVIQSIDALNAMFEDEAKDLKPDEKGNVIYTSMTYATSNLTSNYYYLYIKLEPNVQIYPDFIEYLWNSMPFGLCYDLKISFDVTK